MSKIDKLARDEGRCGYIGDGRDTPCQLVEGWGYDNASSGLCRNHGNRGGKEGNQNAVGNSGGSAPPQNDNAVTHGAFRKRFASHLTEGEQDAFDDAFEQLGTPEGAQNIARTAAAICLLQYQRSGDVRFGRRFESICEKFNMLPGPAEEMDHNYRHAESVSVESADRSQDTADAGADVDADTDSDDESEGPEIGW